MLVMINVKTESVRVNAMLPVRLAPIGIMPNTLLIKIKKINLNLLIVLIIYKLWVEICAQSTNFPS